MLQDLALGPDTVDVSMETLASVWARDPRDLCDLGERRQELPVWDGLLWPQQVSPHLQRNKQLQETLHQREEELLRLQEENTKLREFLHSSFVRKLEQQAKRLSADGRRQLKRSLQRADGGAAQGPRPPQQAGKRVCRNLSAELSSGCPPPEPGLDLWVLRTLGLKDRDTIDTSPPPPGLGPGASVYGAASCSSDCSVTSCLSPPPAALSSDLAAAGLPGGLSGSPEICPPVAACWSPLGGGSSPGATVPFSPDSASSPPPRRRRAPAFSMSLSPSSSVKTHSFPQGQAFVRRDSGGACKFTWVPRQAP